MFSLALSLVLLTLVAALLCRLGLRLARQRTPLQTVLLILLVGGILAIHLMYVFDKLILARWLPFADCMLYTNLSLPLSGLMIGLAWPAIKLPGWRKAAILLGIVVLGVSRSYAPVVGSRPAMSAALWNGQVCRQTTLSTCVPAASATLLAKAGIPASEQELAALSFTFESGTSSLAAYRALKLKTAGTACEAVAFIGSAAELRQQSFVGGIMSIKLAGASASWVPFAGAHEVMLWSFNADGTVLVADPLSGTRLPWTAGEFDRCWPGEGVFLRKRP